MLLALQYPERVLIKFWWLCVPHVGWCDGNPTVGIPFVFYRREKPGSYLNWGYKYPFKWVYHFTFASKSSCAHTLNLVKYPVELTPSLSIKNPPEELFLIYVSFLFSLINTSSLLSPSLSCPFLSFVFFWIFSWSQGWVDSRS